MSETNVTKISDNLKLSITVRYSNNGEGKTVKVLTDATVRVGNLPAVAFKRFAGKATVEWVKKEFRKNPKTFAVQPGWTVQDMLMVASTAV